MLTDTKRGTISHHWAANLQHYKNKEITSCFHTFLTDVSVVDEVSKQHYTRRPSSFHPDAAFETRIHVLGVAQVGENGKC